MALKNLERLAVGSTVTACGEDGSGRMLCVSGEPGLREAGIQQQGCGPCVSLEDQESTIWPPGRDRFPAECFDDFLRYTAACDADDVVLKTRRCPKMRIHGEVHNVCPAIIDSGRMSMIIDAMAGGAAQVNALGGEPQDFSHVIFADDGKTPVRYRVNVTAIEADAQQALEVSLRRLPNDIKTFDDLGIEPEIRRAWERPEGTVLINGVPGSGKTWLLGAGTRALLATGKARIQAYEQPVEMSFDAFENEASLYSASEVGRDVADFAQGIRASLRRAPDILIVGEARDRETITEVLHAGDLGIPVFATTHATRCSLVIRRLLGVYASRDERLERGVMLLSQLRMLITQRLVPPLKSGGWRVALREWLVFDDGLRRRLLSKDMEHWADLIEQEIAARGTSLSHAAHRAFEAGLIGKDTQYSLAASSFSRGRSSYEGVDRNNGDLV